MLEILCPYCGSSRYEIVDSDEKFNVIPAQIECLMTCSDCGSDYYVNFCIDEIIKAEDN